MSTLTKVCLAIALVKISTVPVMASSLDDFYFSINSGYSKFLNDCTIYGETECDREGFSYNFSLGSYLYENIALELNYSLPSNVTSGDYELSLNSYSAGLRFESPMYNDFKFSIKPYIGYQEAKYSPKLNAENGDFTYGLGAGVEYKVNGIISILADYSFTKSSEVAVIDGSAFHQATLGLKFTIPTNNQDSFYEPKNILPSEPPKPISSDYSNVVTYYTVDLPVRNVKASAAYFKLGETEFIDLGMLDSLVNSLSSRNLKEIEVVGFADTTGSDEFNIKISELRAKKVAEYLIKNDFDPSIIKVRGSNHFSGTKGVPDQNERRVTLNIKEIKINN